MAKKDYTSKAAQNVTKFKQEKTTPETTLEPHVEETIRTYMEETYEEPEQTQSIDDYGDDNQSNEEYEQYTRKTYYLTPIQVEAIDIMAFKTKKDKSELVREMLDKAITPEIEKEARERIEEFRTRNR